MEVSVKTVQYIEVVMQDIHLLFMAPIPYSATEIFSFCQTVKEEVLNAVVAEICGDDGDVLAHVVLLRTRLPLHKCILARLSHSPQVFL